MTRTATLAMLTVTALAAGGLFAIAYEVSALEDELSGLNREIVADQEAVHVLKAEWAHLNQPVRLKDLSLRFLELAPIAQDQFAVLNAVPVRLPGQSGAAAAIDRVLAPQLADLAALSPGRRPAPPLAAFDTALTPGRDLTPVAPTALARSLDDILADVLQPQPVAAEAFR